MLLDRAARALAQADWSAAEAAARAALAQGESVAGRLLLGQILIGSGRGRDGLGQIARAVELQPAAIEPRLALAEALVAAGRLDEAAVALVRVRALAPDLTAPQLRLVDILRAAGRHDAAFTQLGQALLANPKSAGLYARLGRLLLLDQARPADALAACERALALDRHCIEALLLRADLHDQADAARLLQAAWAEQPDAVELARALSDRLLVLDPARALVLIDAALLRHPADAALRFGRPRALHRLGRLDEAITVMQALAEAAPDNAQLRYELGLILREAGALDRAEAQHGRLIADHPGFLPPRLALSRLLAEQGRVADAVVVQAATIEAFPTAWEERASFGTNLLRLGEFRRGFAEHEQRLRTGMIEEPEGIGWYPMWQGERLDGRTLWLYPEQGFGDMIQFLRFVPLAAERGGGPVVLGIFPPLARLCGGTAGVVQVVTDQYTPDRDTVRCPLMSLGDRLAITRATLPATVPYLTVPEAARAAWRGCLDELAGFKVGLIWSGNPSHKRDALRSMQPSDLAPLAAIDGISFVLLDRDLSVHGAEGPLALYAPGTIGDFADTAAIIEQLDLVIAVDTAVAHLAGALGRPVWILLDFEGDWRWSVEADCTPWYPTMRLYRQPRPGDWASVMGRVVEDLRARSARSIDAPASC